MSDSPSVAAAKRRLWSDLASLEGKVQGLRSMTLKDNVPGLRNAISEIQEGDCPLLRNHVTDLHRTLQLQASLEPAFPPKSDDADTPTGPIMAELWELELEQLAHATQWPNTDPTIPHDC